eukprot:scaffold2334_cov357-Prasinococcus_capsulatus_cf.AAC.2
MHDRHHGDDRDHQAPGGCLPASELYIRLSSSVWVPGSRRMQTGTALVTAGRVQWQCRRWRPPSLCEGRHLEGSVDSEQGCERIAVNDVQAVHLHAEGAGDVLVVFHVGGQCVVQADLRVRLRRGQRHQCEQCTRVVRRSTGSAGLPH